MVNNNSNRKDKKMANKVNELNNIFGLVFDDHIMSLFNELIVPRLKVKKQRARRILRSRMLEEIETVAKNLKNICPLCGTEKIEKEEDYEIFDECPNCLHRS
jgi:hypothetical protein